MSKTNPDNSDSTHRDLYSGFIRLHVLHHACKEAIFGLGMIEELGRHGYRISPGSLYPMLHVMEQRGYLRSKAVRDGKSLRKEYRATPAGKKALDAAKRKIRELFREVVEEEE
jgi:PadR family transcriptional regulator, regulatory protein PadR